MSGGRIFICGRQNEETDSPNQDKLKDGRKEGERERGREGIRERDREYE